MYGTNHVAGESPMTPKKRSDSAPKVLGTSQSMQSSSEAFGGDLEDAEKTNEGALNVSVKKRASDVMTKSIPNMARKLSILFTP